MPCLTHKAWHICSWYHGGISREETEALLGGHEDGVFLVRDSIHFVGDRTLSVSFEGHIDHYRILTGPEGLVSVDGGDCAFPCLAQLVEVLRHVVANVCQLQQAVLQVLDSQLLSGWACFFSTL